METGLNFTFWASEIKPDGTTTVKLDGEDNALHLTMACFGGEVNRDSRSVLTMKCNERQSPIAVLVEGAIENQQLNLLVAGNSVCEFSVSGRNPSTIHLSGFIQPLVDAEDIEPLGEMESVNEPTKKEVEPDMSSGSQKRQLEEETVEERPKKKKKAEVKKTPEAPPASKVEKKEVAEEEVPVMEEETQSQPAKSPEKSPSTPATKSPSNAKRKDSSTKKKKKKKKKKSYNYTESGLGIKEVKLGEGVEAKTGDTVRLRYIGQLSSSGEIFDKDLADGFTFTVGEGSVVKGLEEGVLGMMKGSKRKLMMPSALAYGNEGSGEKIPPNSDLTFTVELVEIV